MIKTIEKYPVLTLLVVVLLVMLPNLEHLKVTIMEARNFITAREMLSEGNWFLTTMNGIPRYEKPPLPTWITALFGEAFGIHNVFALRFPAVLMVWMTGSYIYLFSKILTGNRRNSLVNGLIAVTSFYIIGIVIEAPWDIYTHGFMIAAIYYLYKTLKSFNKWSFIAASLFIACSVLSKGPISIYALFLPFLIAYTIVYGIRSKLFFKSILVLLFGLAIGSIWFIYVRIADSESFLKIASVETANWSSYNVKPFYYYWSFFIQSGIWTLPALMGLMYPYLIKRVQSKKAYKLSFLWTIFAVVLLSLVPEKKARYLMPVLIPLAINTGHYIFYVVNNMGKITSKLVKIPIYFHFGIVAMFAIIFPLIAFMLFKEKLLANSTAFFIYCLGLLLSGSFMYFFLCFKVGWSVFYSSILCIAFLFITAIPLNPGFANQNVNYQSISKLKNTATVEQIPVYYLAHISPEMLWEYGGIIPQIHKFNQSYEMPDDDRFGVLVTDTTLISNGDFNENYTVQHKETYDINLGKYGTRKHKTRYVSNYYIFKRNTAN